MSVLGAIKRDDEEHLRASRQIGAHPEFWAGVAALARHNLETFDDLPSGLKWFVGDLGRTSLVLASGMLHAQPDGLTLSALYRFARLNRVCSAGRVLMFYNTAVAKRCFIPEATAPRRAGHRTAISPLVLEMLRAFLRNVIRGLRRMGYVDGAAVAWIDDDANFREVRAALGIAVALLPEPFLAPESPVGEMLALEGGPRVLDALLAGCGRDARRLPMPMASRQQLAHSCAFSRTQVSRILAAAEDRGHVSLCRDHVYVAEVLHDDLRRQFSLLFGAVLTALQLCGCPLGSAA